MTRFFLDICDNPFILRSLLAMIFGAIACGMVGTYVVLRRNSYMVGAVSHSLLGGIGLAVFAKHFFHCAWLTPWTGALVAAIIVSLALTWLTYRLNMREDTVLSAVWAIGMAIGITFIQAIPGYSKDINSFLFGSILMISHTDLVVMIWLDIFLVVMAAVCHQRFIVFCFNRELLTLRGISMVKIALMLNLMTALTIVILAQVVGIVLCMALLILPVATASIFSRNIPAIMLLGGLLCLACCLGGVIFSYEPLPNGALLSPCATIIELAGTIFLIALLIRWLVRLFRKPPREIAAEDCSRPENEGVTDIAKQ